MTTYKMPDSMRIGPPLLRVRNIDTTIAFYENSLGLQVNRRYQDNSDNAILYELGFKHKVSSSYDPLLILKHDPNARKTVLHLFFIYAVCNRWFDLIVYWAVWK